MSTNDNFIGPVNIGNPVEITINKLASIIIKLTNSKSKFSYQNLPNDDPVKRKPDIGLAQNKWNWMPLINLEDGLLKTIKYFNKINEIS